MKLLIFLNRRANTITKLKTNPQSSIFGRVFANLLEIVLEKKNKKSTLKSGYCCNERGVAENKSSDYRLFLTLRVLRGFDLQCIVRRYERSNMAPFASVYKADGSHYLKSAV